MASGSYFIPAVGLTVHDNKMKNQEPDILEVKHFIIYFLSINP